MGPVTKPPANTGNPVSLSVSEDRGLGGSIPPLAVTAESKKELARTVERRLDWIGGFSNGFGALIVFLSSSFLFPSTVDHDQYVSLLKVSLAVFVVYMAIAMPL